MKKFKFIVFLMYIGSQSLFAGTVEEAGGALGDVTPVSSGNQLPAEVVSQHQAKGVVLTPYTSYHSATAVNFDPRNSNFEYTTLNAAGDMRCSGTSEQFVDHEIKLLDGDILRWVDIWGDDSNAAEDLAFVLYRTCFPLVSEGSIDSDFLIFENIERNSGNFLYSNFVNKAFKSNNSNEDYCKVMVRIRFGGFDSVNGCDGANDISFYKYRAEIRRNDLIFMDNLEVY